MVENHRKKMKRGYALALFIKVSLDHIFPKKTCDMSYFTDLM
jgi:hypothetical protein